MNGLTDPELLREYAERHTESAFGELVQRHIDLVYSAALRMVRDSNLAEDVTQAVFVALAQHAGQLAQRPVLSGWLHRTAQNLAANAVRSEVRRRAREQEAVVMNELSSTSPEATWEELAPHLDSALGQLSEPDRDALLLRYFERKSARQMAQTLGTSEEAAQKRLNRAVDHLRELLAKRGVAAGAGSLVALLSAQAVQAAPAGLALSVTTAGVLAGTAATTFTASTAATTFAMTTLQKTLIVTALTAAMGLGTYEARQASVLRAQVRELRQQALPPADPARDNALASLQRKVETLAARNNELASALARANAEKVRLLSENEQARRSAALYQDLVARSSSAGLDPTNIYPTSRDVWTAWGKLGRIGALSKQDQSKLSPEEKSALEAAKMKALDELPMLVKAAKQYQEAWPAEGKGKPEQIMDEVACLLYGALNLDEQQFNQVYGVMQKIEDEAKQKGLSEKTPDAEAAKAAKQIMEQFKTETQPLLTAEQAGIFADLVTHIQLEPHTFSFNFNFSN